MDVINMTREEQINKSLHDLFKGAGIDELERLKLGLWYKMGAKFADDNPKVGVNWQQVRIQAAIAAMQLMQTDETFKRWVQEAVDEGGVYYEEYPRIAVNIADALVKELKGE
jgi:dTDP-4-amino-4,6-dideoxygalactose transaminase